MTMTFSFELSSTTSADPLSSLLLLLLLPAFSFFPPAPTPMLFVTCELKTIDLRRPSRVPLPVLLVIEVEVDSFSAFATRI